MRLWELRFLRTIDVEKEFYVVVAFDKFTYQYWKDKDVIVTSCEDFKELLYNRDEFQTDKRISELLKGLSIIEKERFKGDVFVIVPEEVHAHYQLINILEE